MGQKDITTRRRRWLWWTGLASVPVLLAFALWAVLSLRDDRLKHVMAETDRLDPGWRWEDIVASRSVLPDEENALLQVTRVHRLLLQRGRWDWHIERYAGSQNTFDGTLSMGHVPTNCRLLSQHVQAIRSDLEAVPEARDKARRLVT